MSEGVKEDPRKPAKYSWAFGSSWKRLGALANLGRAPNPWERRAVSLMDETCLLAPEVPVGVSFKKISASSLLAYTRLRHAPIMYDVKFPPSARTVVDRSTRSATPPSSLNQPATDPPIPAGGWLVLHSYKLPWTIVVTASSRPSPASTDSASRGWRRLAIVGPSILPRSRFPRSTSESTITILDVLYAMHTTLMVPILPEEWEALGNGSKAQQKVTQAYERRCTRMGGGWEGGVLRIDWLGEKTIMAGVNVDKTADNGGAGKLLFAKP